MRYGMICILLALLIGLHQPQAFAYPSENSLTKFIAKREQIKSGTLTYRFREKRYNESDTTVHIVNVKFFDVKQGRYHYTALISEDTIGNVLVYDIKHTYKFSRKLQWHQKAPHKDFNHEEQYFYEPLARYNAALDALANNAKSKLRISDTLVQTARHQVVEGRTGYARQLYIFDPKTFVPVFHSQEYAGYSDYTLLDYKLNTYDSTSFFRMLSDSIGRLTAASPNTELPRLGPLQDTVAPDFSYPSFTGDIVQLSEVVKRSKVVLLHFWTKSCTRCLAYAFPIFDSLYKKYKHKGLEILSLNILDTDRPLIKEAVAQFDIRFPVLFANNTVLKKYRLQGMNGIFVVSNGNIVYTHDPNSADMRLSMPEVLEKYLN